MSDSYLTIAITSLKPHAGRSTSVMALSWALAKQGHRVMIMDTNQYRSIQPGKSLTGSNELWKNVAIGSRGREEVEDYGANVVVIDAPPLTSRNVLKSLQIADLILVSVFPIAQNQRFLSDAKRILDALDPARVFGWQMAKISAENAYHGDLERSMQKDLGDWEQRVSIPETTSVTEWNPFQGEEPPVPLHAAYAELASSFSARIPALATANGREPSAAKSTQTNAAAPAAEAPAMRKKKAACDEKRASACDPPSPSADGAPSESGVSSGARPGRPGRPQPGAGLGNKAPLPAPGPREETPPWKLLGRPRLSLGLAAAEGGVKLPEGMRTFPDPVPASAVRALLRFGWVHGLAFDADPNEPMRLQPLEVPELDGECGEEDEHLWAGCRYLLSGEFEKARLSLAKAEACADVDFLLGLLSLRADDCEAARDPLARAMTDGSMLGLALGRLGLTVLVDVELTTGVSTHFGNNQRGARLALALALLGSGDARGAQEELEGLAELEPDDVLLRAMRAEWIVENSPADQVETLLRSILIPSYETPIHTLIAIHRARAMHRLGLSEEASLALRDAMAVLPESWSALQLAVQAATQETLETLARIQRLRGDLEQVRARAAG